jgi:hypothetical protein
MPNANTTAAAAACPYGCEQFHTTDDRCDGCNAAAKTTWVDISDRWYFVACRAGVRILDGEGGYTSIRVEGTAEELQRLSDAIAASGERKASITVATKKLAHFIKGLR